MELFDRIGNAITSTGNELVGGAKNFNEIQNCSNQIRAYEDKVEKLTAEVGQLYVDAHLADADAEFADKLSEIRTSKDKIKEIEAKIEEIKKRSSCPRCGAMVEAGQAFCTNCGGNLAELRAQKVQPAPAAAATRIFCTHCGAPNDGSARFCVQCGKQLIQPVIAPVELTADPIEMPHFEGPDIEVTPVETPNWGEVMAAPAPEMPEPLVMPEVPAAEEVVEAVAEAVPEVPAAEEVVEAAAEAVPEVPAAEEVVEAAGEAVPDIPTAEEAAKPSGWFCTECGTKNEEGYLFCIQCGKRRV